MSLNIHTHWQSRKGENNSSLYSMQIRPRENSKTRATAAAAKSKSSETEKETSQMKKENKNLPSSQSFSRWWRYCYVCCFSSSSFFYFGIVFPERRELASAVVCASLGLLREQQEQLNFQTKDTKSSKRKERTKKKNRGLYDRPHRWMSLPSSTWASREKVVRVLVSFSTALKANHLFARGSALLRRHISRASKTMQRCKIICIPSSVQQLWLGGVQSFNNNIVVRQWAGGKFFFFSVTLQTTL